MKIYALSGMWGDFAIVGVSLDRETVEKQKKIIEDRYKAASRFDPHLMVEVKVKELEVTNEYTTLY